jgi:hypothetical protein
MKRILSVMALAAALALATGTMALARRHAAKSGQVPAQPAATCADAAHCPFGSCPLGSKSAATAVTASTPATGKEAACADPSKCTPACRPGSSGATAAAVTKP